MKTFEVYGDVYPEDSKYARLMAQYMMPPTYGREAKVEWELYRDFALKKRMSDKDMKAFMIAKDSAHHNMILGRPPRTERDMEELYSRQFRSASSRVAEDECSGKTDTLDYVRCRAKKMEKEQGTPADKAFPTAWSIACKYKRDQLSDADEHCQKKPNEYFKSKKANGDSMKNRKKTAAELEAELEMTAGHTPESFKKMMKENPELEEEWNKQIEENRGVVSSLEEKWASVSDLFSKPHESVYGKVSEDDTEIMAKFEKGVSADPTKNMSPEDKKKWEAMKDKHGDKFKQATFNRSAKENPMNKTARVALRTLTANWGLTANEAYEMLAEEELAEYLAEMEAEMWAEEMEAGGNKSFDKYLEMGKPGAFQPNTTNQDRGGQGAGGKGNKNYLYHDYGKANSYAPDYYKRYYKRKQKKPEGIKRRNCPDMKGGKFPCTKTKEEKKKSN